MQTLSKLASTLPVPARLQATSLQQAQLVPLLLLQLQQQPQPQPQMHLQLQTNSSHSTSSSDHSGSSSSSSSMVPSQASECKYRCVGITGPKGVQNCW